VPPGARPVAPPPGVAYTNGQVVMPGKPGVAAPKPVAAAATVAAKKGPKPQEDHTLINCFTVEQIETHIKSLNRGLQLPPAKLKIKCLDVLKVLQGHQHGWVFNSPVDPVELGLPDYFQVIKRPMDLGSIRKRLENGCYRSLEEFEADVHLTFDNAMLYNPEGSVVYNMADEMKVKFKSDYEALIGRLNAEEDTKRKNGDACALCGGEKLLFEPPVFYCNGPSCPSKRIRRNSYYYVGGNNQYHWCHQCFGDLKDSIPMADVTLTKTRLVKKKNDEVHEESWVQCDKCERWIHQICGLFNTRQNKDQRSEYICPKCTIEDRKKRGVTEGTSTTPMAEDLPRTKLSQYLEKHVREKMGLYMDKAAKAKMEAEKMSEDEARKAVDMGGHITIRQVSSMDRRLDVRERMQRRYAFKDYPKEFNFRCKCIVVFQNLDGVDVILFGLYVYEHDERNPAPNSRAVYVSYLDSVHYMRPRKMRTFIYHEILISYLDFVRRKGFSTAHIWACPPLKGDDYILYAKPEDQKTPKDDRLRQWYIDMLVECQRRGVVGRLTNMYDLYFANPKNDATVVPYMDGDYFPAEVENIIKDLEEGRHGKKSGGGGSKKKKGQSKSKSKAKAGNRGGTRASGIDEEALSASGIIPPGVEQKSLEAGGRDFVMAKLGEIIHPMKESFIVAYLTWRGVKPENLVVPKEILEYRDKHPEEQVEVLQKGGARSAHPLPSKSQQLDSGKGEGDGGAGKDGAKNDGKPTDGDKDKAKDANGADKPKDKDGDALMPDASTSKSSDAGEEKKEDNGPAKAEEAKSSSVGDGRTNGQNAAAKAAEKGTEGGASMEKEGEDGNKVNAVSTTPREGKFAAMAARKRDSDGKVKEEGAEEASKPADEKDDADVSGQSTSEEPEIVRDGKGRIVKVLNDDDEEMDCEFLNNRQAFLNLCQGNHYQYDQLRRAKHSSMMVLWHLHNRDAPKFVQQCAVCSREILTGYRYHCPTCADYDQCHECVSNPNTPRHPHQLKPIPVATGKQNELTMQQRKERQRSIQLHMTLLLHAATCISPKCPSANCTKMKGLLKHGASCQIKATGGCHVCKRIWALLQIHARQCKQSKCPVPNCMAIRERFRQLTKQQQAMDDRRRQEMNRHYRGVR